MLTKFADHAILEGEVEWRTALWTEVRKLKGWVNKNYMKFNRKKFDVLWVAGHSAWNEANNLNNNYWKIQTLSSRFSTQLMSRAVAKTKCMCSSVACLQEQFLIDG